MTELLELFPNNATILDAAIKFEDHINRISREGGKIMVSISGGSDSDIMMDMTERLGYAEGEVVYVWFDTGLEYDATKRHLKDLEAKYGIEIKRYRPEMTVAQSVRRYGVPFLSKQCSEFVERLQKRGFTWIHGRMEDLTRLFIKCRAALRWWCNDFGEKSSFNISSSAGLRDFMIENHPPKVSNKCCHYAKKKTAETALVEISPKLNVTGVRRAEGGARATRYSSCFSHKEDGIDSFRPIFYFTDQDKQEYKEFCGVTYSDCYEVWGLKRTGCCCCPFGSKFEEELELVKQHEPKLYAAACKIFGPSYEYTRKYRKFKESCKREKRRGGQIDLFDDPYERKKEGVDHETD